VRVPTSVPSFRSFTALLNTSHAEAQRRSASTTNGTFSGFAESSVRLGVHLPSTSHQ
jgi:hypothetical protein